jgi:hypothetical protein
LSDNQILPSVSIELGGKTRRLVFDFNAQAVFEKVTGISVFDAKATRVSSRMVRAMLWAQLLHFDEQVRFDEYGEIVTSPEISLRQAGALVTIDTLREVQTKCLEAYNLFFKSAKKQEGEKPQENPPSR